MKEEGERLLIGHAVEMLDDLLDQVAALVIWTIEYSRKNKIPQDAALGFHIQRIIALLHELGHPPSIDLIDRTLSRDVTRSYQNPFCNNPKNWRALCLPRIGERRPGHHG